MNSLRDCRNVQRLLNSYVDQTLSAETTWSVQLHLASCAVCAEAARELERAASLLKSLAREEPSARFDDALARRLADQVLRQPEKSALPERLRRFGQARRDLPGPSPALRWRSALAAVTVAAAVIPAALGIQSRLAKNPHVATRPVAVAPAAVEGQQFLNRAIEEHSASLSAEPLGDGAGWISSVAYGGNSGDSRF